MSDDKRSVEINGGEKGRKAIKLRLHTGSGDAVCSAVNHYGPQAAVLRY